jgi:hypothetical protein
MNVLPVQPKRRWVPAATGGLDRALDDFGAKGLAVWRRDTGEEWGQEGLVNPADHCLHA